MEKKKGKKKKIRFNYFLKRKIIIGVCLLLAFIGGVVTVFAITNKEDDKLESNQPEAEKVIPAECPYTLDELEEAITSGWLFGPHAWRDYGEDADNMAYILFHFYNYFSKETEFTVWEKFDTKTGEVLSYKKISYDEYMKYRDSFYFKAEKARKSGVTSYVYHSNLKSMMFAYAELI